MDPNLRTLRGSGTQASLEIEKDNERIEKLYLEHQRRTKVNKLEDFNKYVLH
jgi:hypothetical protein